MTSPMNSPITSAQDAMSERYESKTGKLFADLSEEVRKVIAQILIAENRLEDEALKARIVELVSSIKPTLSRASVVEAAKEGYELGIAQAGLDKADDFPAIKNSDVKDLSDQTMDYFKSVKDQAKKAIQLAKKLPLDKNYVDTVIGSVKQVENKANSLSSYLANTAQAEGSLKAAEANDYKVMWVNENNACLKCLSYAGRVTSPDKAFSSSSFDPKDSVKGVKAPPLHPHCRCRLRIWDGPNPRKPEDIPTKDNNVTFPEALQREARRAVLRGASEYDSLPKRIKAAEKLLDSGAFLPKTVEARASKAVAQGQFPVR